MKKILLLCMALMAMFSCNKKDINSLKDDVSDLKTRVTVLEELCKQNNTNIVSLQTVVNAASNTGDYVTAVAPITKDGEEIGYTISFAKQAAITIYHGKNGGNGTSPVIGVKKFTDDVYYWTLNGEWLTDEAGNKLRVSGKDGESTNGITPQLKVEDDMWYVSYDKGETWTFVSKAKGEKGDDGDAMFKGVTQDEKNVYFTLADETVFAVVKLGNGEIPRVVITDGALPGEFSVSATKKVRFSRGNLEVNFNGGANKETWRFMSEQYDFRGSTKYNDNFNSWSYNDLLGWGTSGWNSGAVAYKVSLSTSKVSSDYYPGNDPTNNLTGEYANADWGVYNSITNGGNQVGLWRTLTKEEYSYLLNDRTDAKNKYGLATVGSVAGLVLLPDNWKQLENVVFTAGITYGYTTNVWTIIDWKNMEAAGAVFLPAAGHRDGTTVYSAGEGGWYWSSSSASKEQHACLLHFSPYQVVVGSDVRYQGASVRLVQDVQ